MIYQVKCKSGLTGWRCRLRENYQHPTLWKRYASTYNLHIRLGFKSIKAAWEQNPVIEGSVKPDDFRIAPKSSKLWQSPAT